LQSDDSVHAYFKSCLEEPDTCAIKRKNSTADDLYDEVVKLLEETKYHPIILGDNFTVIDHGTLKVNIYSQIKTGMVMGQNLSIYLNSIMERNLTAYQPFAALDLSKESDSTIFPNYGQEAIYGIECPDTELRSDSLEGVQSLVNYNYNESYYGGTQPIGLLIVCAQWKMRSKETFTGPFQVRTKNPILFVSSPLDPATPMASARNMSQGFEGSTLLQQNGIGVS